MGTDASAQPMAEGSTEKLARICRKQVHFYTVFSFDFILIT